MKFAGYSTWTSNDGKTTLERDLLRCCHCQFQWYVKPGSGNQRGWCSMCNEPTCGALKCQSCIPFMRKIDEQEKRQRNFAELGL